MELQNHKLQALCRLAGVLNAHGIHWAVGGSLLLYLHGKTDTFHDIDLMVCEEDFHDAAALLTALGTTAPERPRNEQFQTRHFLELTVDGVDVDVIAGFVIVSQGTAYDCPLLPSDITGCVALNGQRIPLHSLTVWKRYYTLMGRPEKAAMTGV